MRSGTFRRSLKAWHIQPSIRTSWCTRRPWTVPGGSREGAETLGIATHVDDVGEILRLADLYVTDIEHSDLIEWQGGGPDDWPGLSEHHEEQHEEQHEEA